MGESDDGPAPDFDRIEARDLRDDERLRALYVEAVRRGFWPNSPRTALEFAAYAEKALADDTRGTPGRLFYGLVKRKDGAMVTQSAEDRAMARFPSRARQEMVDEAAASAPRRAAADEAAGEGGDAVLGPDVGYVHAVLMQCFLPQQATAARQYSTSHGKASLLVEAGSLANPDRPAEWKLCDLPSGSKPRLILPYVVGEALRSRSPEVDLGNSLRSFMAKLGMPVTGHNGKVLTEQVQNLAAATVLIGEWSEEAVHTNAGRVAKRVSFWLERRPNQLTFWTPTMTLSDEFFQAIQEHRVPIDVRHLVRLARSPRRMDLYAWLSYRTPRLPPRRRQPVSLRALWPVFAPGIDEFFNFKNRIRSDLKAIAEVYPHFRVEIDGDVLWLRRSPPPVPFSGRTRLPARSAH